MWKKYFNASSLAEVLDLLDQPGQTTRLIAGGTDILLELEKQDHELDLLIDVSRIEGLDRISVDASGIVHIGPLVTHNQCVESTLLRKHALPLVMASYMVGSPQIRNRGTIAGNVITASPANDTISPLMALDATLTLLSKRGERKVPLSEFYKGVRKTFIAGDEILTDISFMGLNEHQQGVYKKFALRRAQAISLVNAAIVLSLEGGKVNGASITLGAVAPTIIHARKAEKYLAGKPLTESVIAEASRLAASEIAPISDIRSSAGYRVGMAETLITRGLVEIQSGKNGANLPAHPVLLWGDQSTRYSPVIRNGKSYTGSESIHALVNHQPLELAGGYQKTLLRWIREEAQLIGTKEGCAEGECGACTVFLDGKAVMSCLVAAPRVDQAELITIEGLGEEGQLSAVQQAFVEEGAVQCGYCTPGFVMASEKLLEENSTPDMDDIKMAISGNLCRCTGYYKIVRAIEKAANYESGLT